MVTYLIRKKNQKSLVHLLKNDIICTYESQAIGIEIKKCKTPGWMQCSLKYNKSDNKWEGSKRGENHYKCREIFDNIIQSVNIYDGATHEEWVSIKASTNKWNDVYFPISNDTIKNLYKNKKCYYIQISNYRLYHLGNDICKFGVPEFIIDQRLRVRTQIHRKNDKGYCRLSVNASCLPININQLEKSPYSLDCAYNLPNKLVYKSSLE